MQRVEIHVGPNARKTALGRAVGAQLDEAFGTITDKRQAKMFSDEETGTAQAGAEIKQFLERVERLEEEAAGIRGDIKDIFAEAKGRGFDVKALRHILKLRKQDKAERDEFETIVDLYLQAIGEA